MPPTVRQHASFLGRFDIQQRFGFARKRPTELRSPGRDVSSVGARRHPSERCVSSTLFAVAMYRAHATRHAHQTILTAAAKRRLQMKSTITAAIVAALIS